MITGWCVNHCILELKTHLRYSWPAPTLHRHSSHLRKINRRSFKHRGIAQALLLIPESHTAKHRLDEAPGLRPQYKSSEKRLAIPHSPQPTYTRQLQLACIKSRRLELSQTIQQHGPYCPHGHRQHRQHCQNQS